MLSATLWLLDGNLVHHHDIGFFVQQLGASEARRYVSFKRRERQRQFLLARILLRLAVSSVTDLPPGAISVIERDHYGPELVFPDSLSRQPKFSLSHSRNWVACALSSSGTVGVDIEVNDATRDILGISQLGFHPNEHRWILSQVGSARLSAFYHIWCIKEALYKLTSTLGRETVSSPVVDADGAFTLQGAGWHRYTVPHSFLMVAICSDRPFFAIHKVELTGLSRTEWLVREREFR